MNNAIKSTYDICLAIYRKQAVKKNQYFEILDLLNLK